MSSQINRDLLHQEWVHAYEEDTPTDAVYRPAHYELPPARGGRTGFELRPDQTVTNVGIGRTDVPEETTGSWELEEDDVPTVRIHLNTGETRRLPILSLEKDRLVVRK
jgi:hypothetical protein